MEDKYLPSSRTAVHVNTSGAIIVEDEATEERDEAHRVEAAVFGNPHHASAAASAANGNSSNGNSISNINTDSPGSRDSHDIYLPKHTEWISHVAIDIGGSLAKVVYFSRAATPPTPGKGKGKGRELLLLDSQHINGNGNGNGPNLSRPASPGRTTPIPNGVLGPESIASSSSIKSYFERNPSSHSSLSRSADSESLPSSSSSSSSNSAGATPSVSTDLPPNAITGTQPIRGGYLNFTKFETGDIDSCIEFINYLIESSAASHQIPSGEFKKKHVKIMATGGGAHLFYDRLSEELGVEVRKEEEMECLIAGLTFFMEIPHEVFWYSDQLVHSISHPAAKCSVLPNHIEQEDLPRPSPNPPQYALVFDEHPTPQFPCMLVNIGSGVSIIKVDGDGKYERISGTSLGGGTLWGLLSLLTGADTFDEMLALSEKGDNSNVDMLVGDIYGSDYSKIGLKSSTIASTFGKVFRKGERGKKFNPEDIARSLLYAISNNIGQIAYMNAEKHNLDRIYFGGCFIRGHSATISTLSYAIRFWSKGTKRALFLRHEGYLGAIGAWLRNIEEEDSRR